MKKILISAVAAVCLMMIMTGCNVESGQDPDPPGDVADSILMFEKIKNNFTGKSTEKSDSNKVAKG